MKINPNLTQIDLIEKSLELIDKHLDMIKEEIKWNRWYIENHKRTTRGNNENGKK